MDIYQLGDRMTVKLRIISYAMECDKIGRTFDAKPQQSLNN